MARSEQTGRELPYTDHLCNLAGLICTLSSRVLEVYIVICHPVKGCSGIVLGQPCKMIPKGTGWDMTSALSTQCIKNSQLRMRFRSQQTIAQGVPILQGHWVPTARLGGIRGVPLQGAFGWVGPGLRSAPPGTVQAQPEEHCLDLQDLLSLIKKCKSLQKARE